jgi:RNA polymerase sigma factor (sigma-70 family)
MSTEPIRLLLVDDHPVTSAGLARELEAQGDIAVIGLAGSVAEVVSLFQQALPEWTRLDLVLADLRLPDGTGAELCRRLRAGGCSARFLIYTGYDEDGDLWDAQEAGAEGFIGKSADVSEVARAVRDVHAGQRLWTSEQEARARQWWNEVGSKLETLTERERQVLMLIAEALSNRQIAERLGLSENTVETHVRNVLNKLHLSTRQEALRLVLTRMRNVGKNHGFP